MHGIHAEQATRGVDVAVCAVSLDVHDEVVALLVATGYLKPHHEKRHSLIFHDPNVGSPAHLDLVPFGEIEAPAGAIAWPPKCEFVMNVLVFAKQSIPRSIRYRRRSPCAGRFAAGVGPPEASGMARPTHAQEHRRGSRLK
jgi:hypothetical protein